MLIMTAIGSYSDLLAVTNAYPSSKALLNVLPSGNVFYFIRANPPFSDFGVDIVFTSRNGHWISWLFIDGATAPPAGFSTDFPHAVQLNDTDMILSQFKWRLW